MPKTIVMLFIVLFTSLMSPSALSLTASEKENLITIRNQIFGGSTLNAAFTQTTLSGQTPPVFPFYLHDRVLMVWKIKQNNIESFTSMIDLPSYLAISKVTPLTESKLHRRFSSWLSKQTITSFDLFSKKKHFYFFADIAQTTGAEQGLKIEWKTFVTHIGSANPQTYRFASFKQIPGNDLLGLFNPTSSNIVLVKNKRKITTSLTSADGYEFEADIPLNSLSHTKRKILSESYLNAAERTYGPLGIQTRYYYDGSSVSTHLQKVNPQKVTVNSSLPWFEHAHSLIDVIVPQQPMSFMAQPITANVEVSEPALGPAGCYNPNAPDSPSKIFACLVALAISTPQDPTSPQLVFKQMFDITPDKYIPTFYYALQDLYKGLSTLGGIAKPTLFFELQTVPKTIFINFEIKASKVKAFKEAFLPSHFKLAKIRFYPEQKRALYAVSLNLYQSSGANLNGIRAEWSTYVINPLEDNPRPRFSVIEAQSNIDGLDPLFTLERIKSGDVSIPFNIEEISEYIEKGNTTFTYNFDEKSNIRAHLVDTEEDKNITLNIDIAYPDKSKQLSTRPLTSWMEANDYVYWGEVADILAYDKQVMFADLIVFEASDDDVIEDTTFSQYVKSKPLPIIIWVGGQSIALQPWGNLESITPE